MSSPDFWADPSAAQAKVGRMKALRAVVEPLAECLQSDRDLADLFELAEEDDAFVPEIRQELGQVEQRLEKLQLEALLSGENDALNAIVTIVPRDGGTDACDWAEMLLGMYMAWASQNGYSVEVLDREDNIEAGIDHATIAIRGPMAYGYLKGETGHHRLVRMSPFNADGKRQTSFAAVDVTPEVDETIEIEIDPESVREDTFRSSGAGGQHVNKTNSAIRLTHVPTGIVVQCQQERSQHKNRATAWRMLRAAMLRIEEEKREAELADSYKNKARVGFGSQIRNYFLHPEQRVKDARTKFETGNFDAVMNGNLQDFLEATLRWRVGQTADEDGDGDGD